MHSGQYGRVPVDYACLRRMVAGGRLPKDLRLGWDRDIESHSVCIAWNRSHCHWRVRSVRKASVRVPVRQSMMQRGLPRMFLSPHASFACTPGLRSLKL